MCMEDIRIMRNTYTTMRVVDTGIGGNGAVIADRAPTRVAIHFDSDSATRLQINTRDFIGQQRGIAVSNVTPRSFNIFQHGDMVMGTWFAENINDAVITVTETFLPESFK